MESFLPYSISDLSSIAKFPEIYLVTGKEASITPQSVSQLWHQLKETVYSPSVTDKHMTSACNAMCAVIRHVAQNGYEEVRSLAYSVKTLEDLFNASLKAFDGGKSKPGLQVLETLVHLALKSPRKSDAIIAVNNIVKKMVMVLMERGPPSRLKESCIVLLFFFRKASDIVSYPGVITSAVIETRDIFYRCCLQNNLVSVHLNHLDESNLFAFFLAIVFTVGITEARTAATKLFSHLCSPASGGYTSKNLLLATRAIEMYVNANNTALDDLAKNLFPVLSSNANQFKVILAQYQHVQHISVSTMLISMSLLEIGRNRGFVSEAELPNLVTRTFANYSETANVDTEDYATFERLLRSRWPQIRLRAFNLLFMSPSTNALIPTSALRCLLDTAAHIHDETDSYMRGELLSIFKRLMVRLQRSWQSPKVLVIGNHAELIEQAHAQYVIFVSRFFEFLRSELSTHVSYARRILSLYLMEVMLNYHHDHPTMFQPWVLVDRDLLAALLPLLIDAYEEVREVVTRLLLQIAGHDLLQLKNCIQHFNLVQRASSLAGATNRNDHADGFGRILMLNAVAYSTEVMPMTNSVWSSSIGSVQSFIASLHTFSVSSGFPLHGTLLGLKHIFDNIAECQSLFSEEEYLSLLNICQSIWTLSQPYLCVDSPETEAEDLEYGDCAGPKDLLAYSWRALRDSSLLIQGILKNSSPSKATFLLAGNMSFDQLARLRHRGAFSTVAQTFALCCHLVRQSDDPQIQGLNELWYQKALSEIEIQSTQLTRRSAGLPAMLVGVLDAKSTSIFQGGVQDLWKIATRTSKIGSTGFTLQPSLPQVHALNCLKDIVMNSRFRTMTETLIVPMLYLAASCFASSSWAIRNCGLMLFRACITRLDAGADINQNSSEETLLKLSDNLSSFDLAVNLLSESPNPVDCGADAGLESSAAGTSTMDQNEAVFAALDLLSRIYIKKAHRPHAKNLIEKQLGARLWHVRELAARLFATLVLDGDEINSVNSLLSLEDAQWTSNEMHGRLVACQEIIHNYVTISDMGSFLSLQDLINTLCINVSRLISVHGSTGMSSAIDMMNEILAVVVNHPAHLAHVYERFHSVIEPLIKSNKDQPYLVQRAFTLLEVYGLIANNTSQMFSTIHQLLQDGDVALYVMDTLKPVVDRIYSRSFMSLCVEIILEANREDVCCSAMINLCCYLKSDDRSLPLNVVPSILEKININDQPTRHYLTVRLKFSATIIRQTWGATDSTSSVLQDFVYLLLHDLVMAASDTIDSNTRLAASEAIELVTPTLLLQELPSQMLSKGHCLDLLMLIYDLLDDDDQDVRWHASSIVDMLVNSSWTRASVGIGMSSAFAREQLLSFLVRNFASDSAFHRRALCRLLEIPYVQRSLEDLPLLKQIHLLTPIPTQIQAIVASAGDLFAEEKQNLYIDDTADIMNWAKLLRTTYCDSFDDDIIEATTNWTIEGLKNVLALLTAEYQEVTARSDHPTEDSAWLRNIHRRSIFSFTFNPGIMIIILRLVILATVLRTFTQNCRNQRLKELESLLLQFREVCQGTKINPWIVKRITTDDVQLQSRNEQLSRQDQAFAMKSRLTIFVCFIVITPLCAWGGWKIWKWYMLEQDLVRIEQGLERQQAGMAPAVSAS